MQSEFEMHQAELRVTSFPGTAAVADHEEMAEGEASRGLVLVDFVGSGRPGCGADVVQDTDMSATATTDRGRQIQACLDLSTPVASNPFIWQESVHTKLIGTGWSGHAAGSRRVAIESVTNRREDDPCDTTPRSDSL